jgi:hypothetical protein
LVEELHSCLNKTLTRLSRKSDTAAAIRYALSRWRALSQVRLYKVDRELASAD